MPVDENQLECPDCGEQHHPRAAGTITNLDEVQGGDADPIAAPKCPACTHVYDDLPAEPLDDYADHAAGGSPA